MNQIQTIKELLEELIDEKEKVKAQLSSLCEKEMIATLNDDDYTYFTIASDLGDLECYYERLIIAIDAVEDFMKEEIK